VSARHPVLAVLQNHGTRELWHYTLCSNLPHIVEHQAIFSRVELEARGIRFESDHYYGSDEKQRILGAYVSCATMPPWGMMASEEDELAILELTPNVVTDEGTCFCPGWSPWAVFDAGEIVTWRGPAHAEAIYVGEGFQTIAGAEIFVPRSISFDHVRRIVFFDSESRQRARDAMARILQHHGIRLGRRITLAVEPRRFPRDWQQAGPPWAREGREDDVPF
jgi:hypothetical protein